MKKNYLIILTVVALNSFSQKDYSRYYNSWRLGLNAGAAWQTADVRSCWGMAGGITLEKGFHENSTNFFSFAIRGRYLSANTYGMDFKRNYNVKSNDAYNGTYNPTVNYQADTATKARGYVYDNYKMTLGEGALELQITFNKLREKSHVLLNLWGGVGFTSYRTFSNLLDGNGKLYNFAKVDSSGNQSTTLSSYSALIDNNYESYALGSKNGNLVTFSPSGGIGLGYQFSPGFSMIWEYKITLPQGANADLLDGKISTNTDKIGGSNDYYHYAGVNFLFTLRGKNKTTSTPRDENVYTNTTTTNSVVTTNTVVYTPPTLVPEQKPIIRYVTPPSNGQVTNNPSYKISAQILNITHANQIKLYFNTALVSNYNFNSQTHVLEYDGNLNIGTNYIQIIATNTAGTDDKSTTVVYEKPLVQQGIPPTVDFTSPNNCPFIAQDAIYNVGAICTHVTSKNNISVKINNVITPIFNFNITTGQITFPLNLVNGNNSILISVTNNFGNDVASCNIGYTVPPQLVVFPVISFINPSQSNYVSENPTFTVNAQVLNVNGSGNISVYYNGVSIVFTYNIATKKLTFPVNLNEGINTIVINAYNSAGDDNKSTSIIYHAPIIQKLPPNITFTNPATTPFTVKSSNFIYAASITNMSSSTGLVVKYNGLGISNFTYNGSNLTYNATLNVGANVLEIKATNSDGSDLASAVINYTPKANPTPPVVSLVNPAFAMNSTDNLLYNFGLTVFNVNTKNDIEVTFNGNIQTNFTFDNVTKMVNFSGNLEVGNNTLVVKGANQYGVDFKTVNVSYTPHADIKLPPSITFINPAVSPGSSANTNYTYNATIGNMPTNSGITVTYNGNIITNYNYDGFNLNFNSTLNSGLNTLDISAANNDGNDAKQATVNYKPRVITRPPVVTITTPINNPTVSVAPYAFNFSATNVSQNQMVVTLNGNVISSYLFASTLGSFNTNLIQGNNTLVVTATNADGTDSKTELVYYKGIAATDTTTGGNGSSFNGDNSQKKMLICHTQPGSNQSAQSIYIPLNAWPTHQAHGDTYGPCVTAPNGTSGDELKITICHIPPGNNQNSQTITIPISAWPAHQAHGDTKGVCAETNGTNDTLNKNAPKIIPRGINPAKNTNTESNDSPEISIPPNNQSRPR